MPLEAHVSRRSSKRFLTKLSEDDGGEGDKPQRTRKPRKETTPVEAEPKAKAKSKRRKPDAEEPETEKPEKPGKKSKK